jgi:acetyl esterase/lipase
MIGLGIILGVIILYLALVFFLPKGTWVQEGVYMPFYWWKLKQVRPKGLDPVRVAFGPHRMQYLLYYPPPDGTPKQETVIVYFHGGGWRFGVPSMFKSNAQYFLRRGFPVIMPSYRRTPKYKADAIREDLALAMAVVAEVMKKENWVGYKILLGGMSAGGNLAALIALDNDLLSKGHFKQQDLAGLFLCGAPLDLAKMEDSQLLFDYAGPRSGALFPKASPITFISGKETFPILCIHGTKDGMVAFESANSFIEAFRAKAPGKVTFHPLPGGSHLDAGSWPYQEEPAGRILSAWLEGGSNE